MLGGWRRRAFLCVVVLAGGAAADSAKSGPSSEALARSAALSSSGSAGERLVSALKKLDGVPRAIEIARLEQELEDLNTMCKYDGKLERVLIVMPLTEQFDPPVGQFGQGHVQTSDRVSIPKSVMMQVIQRNLDVPWQFEIQRVQRDADGNFVAVKLPTSPPEMLESVKDLPQVARVTCSILDYRSPEQYVFVPDWMMKSLRLKPRDLVRLKYKRMSQGTGCVYLQAHTSELANLHNADKVLEEELRHYSSLTSGTTINFIFNPSGSSRKGKGTTKNIFINVVKCLDGDQRPVDSVCIQDSDVSTEWLPPLDTPEAAALAKKRMRQREVKRRQMELEKEEENPE